MSNLPVQPVLSRYQGNHECRAAPEAVSGLLPHDAAHRILVLRHAEEKGGEQAARLSSTGRMRAFALPYLVRDISLRDG